MSSKIVVLIFALCALESEFAQGGKLQSIEDLPVFPAENYETPLTRPTSDGGVEDVPDRQGSSAYVIFRVEKATEAEVAVKIVEDADELPYVMNEVLVLELLKEADVPNTIRYRAAYRREDNLAVYIVTDFINGETLDEFQLRKDPALTEEEIARSFASFLSTLFHLQKINVLHRDIKPTNLKINKNFQLKLIDFGYAEILKKKNNFKVNDYVGSPFTMAPEALMAQDQDSKADLWSAFAVLFMWFEETENGPFEHLCTDECRARHEEDPTLIDEMELTRMNQKLEMSDKTPQMAQDLIRRVFTVDPTKRPSLNEVMTDAWFRKYGITFDDAKKFHPRNITTIGIEEENDEEMLQAGEHNVDTTEPTVISVNEQVFNADNNKNTKNGEKKSEDNDNTKSGAEVDNQKEDDDDEDDDDVDDNDNADGIIDDIDNTENDVDDSDEDESVSSSDPTEQEYNVDDVDNATLPIYTTVQPDKK